LIAFFLYLTGAILFLACFWFESRKTMRWAIILMAIAFIFQTLGIVTRFIAAGRLPSSNLFEFMVLFSWGVTLLYLLACKRFNAQLTGAVVVPLQVLLMAYGITGLRDVQPLVPALQSFWLQFHVVTAIISYSLFALSFAAAILYLWQDKRHSNFLSIFEPEKISYIAITWGFLFMTLVLVTGAVWAEEVWGSWWTWDPKETWALITWFVYTIYLHLYRSKPWSSRAKAWIAVAGFGAVVFTLLGVSFLLPGVHSYL
jgi:ABC-type transport system involved in cytochrome c biogenesis permease subunit